MPSYLSFIKRLSLALHIKVDGQTMIHTSDRSEASSNMLGRYKQ